MRWKYDAGIAEHGHPRHHAHFATTVSLDDDMALELDKVHLPTGWVTIEEVIRFLIVDLGMAPPCGDGWPTVLRDSENMFFDEFTGKRYRPEDAERTGYGRTEAESSG